MKNKKIKICIDVLLLVSIIFTFVSLLFSDITIHIVSGIIIIPVVAAHLAVNFSWIKAITKNLFKGKLNKRSIRLYIVFILLTILFLGSIISGVILVSGVIPPEAKEAFHAIPSVLFYIVTIIHIIMHIGQIKTIFLKRKKYKNRSEDKTVNTTIN